MATTTTTKKFEPASLANFMAEAFGFGQQVDQATNETVLAGSQRNQLATQAAAAVQERALAAATEASATAAVDTAAALIRANILRTLNLHPEQTDNELNRTANAIFKTDEKLAALKPEIDRRMSVGIMDNPLEWLINQVRLPGMVSQYNGIVSDQNNSISRFKDLTALANSEQTVTNAIQADQLAKLGQAKAAKAAADAKEKLIEIQQQNLVANTRDQLNLVQLAGQKLQMMGTVANMQMQRVSEENAAEERKQLLQIQLSTAKLAEETHRLQLADRKRAIGEEAANLETFNRLVIAAGGQPYSLQAFKTLKPSERDELIKIGYTGKFGSDFESAFAFQSTHGNLANIATGGAAGSIPWQQNTLARAKDLAKQSRADWEKTNVGKAPTQKQVDSWMLDGLSKAQALYESEYTNNMRTASAGNPYKIDYVTVSKKPELTGNPVAAIVNRYGPQGSEPVFKEIDEKQVLAKIAEDVRTLKVPASAAAKSISDFYKQGMQQQAEVTHYLLYGLPMAKQYQVDLDGSKVDLANPTAVEKYLTVYTARGAARNFGSSGLLWR